MLKYTIKRLFQSLITVLIVVTIVFLLMRMMPTDYYFTEEQFMKLTEQQRHDQLQDAGLLDPLPKQLFRYYGQLMRFDFGNSRRIQTGVPVLEVIGIRFAVSMQLGCVALIISMLIGGTIGVLQARHKNRLPDHLGTAYTIFVNAVPTMVSYSLILIFGTWVLGLPSLYSVRNPVISGILPVICLALPSIAVFALWVRRYMVDEMNKDYIKLARVKGMTSRDIMVKHVLKNAFVPLVQYIPESFLLTIGGSLLVERFFSIPGMGPLLTDAINRYDINVVQTCVLIYAVLGVFGVFLGDVLMMLIDPRINLTKGGAAR